MSVFDLSVEAFEAAKEEFGEPVSIVRKMSYPFIAIFTEKNTQVFNVSNGNMVDTVQLYIDIGTEDMKEYGVYAEQGDRIQRKDRFYTVVELQERTGFQRLRLHQEKPTQTARAW